MWQNYHEKQGNLETQIQNNGEREEGKGEGRKRVWKTGP